MSSAWTRLLSHSHRIQSWKGEPGDHRLPLPALPSPPPQVKQCAPGGWESEVGEWAPGTGAAPPWQQGPPTLSHPLPYSPPKCFPPSPRLPRRGVRLRGNL